MLKISFIALSCLFISFNLQAKGFEGHWFSVESENQRSSYMAEFTKDRILIKRLSKGETFQYSLSYKKKGSSKIRIEGPYMLDDVVSDVNWEENSVVIPIQQISLRQGLGIKKMKFFKAPKLNFSDVVGTWVEYSSDSSFEESTIVTQKKDSYSLDGLSLNHDNKTYKKSNISYKTNFTKGYIFTDISNSGKDDYLYYVYSYINGEMSFIDLTGFKWSQKSAVNPKHPLIPEGYKEKKKDFYKDL